MHICYYFNKNVVIVHFSKDILIVALAPDTKLSISTSVEA